MELLVIWFLCAGVCAATAATIAERKGHSAVGWFLITFLFLGAVGPFVALVLPDVGTKRKDVNTKRNVVKGKISNRGARVAAAVSVSIVVIFTLASLVFHYAGLSTPDTNYCGPLGYWMAFNLDIVLGKFSFLFPLVLALAAIHSFTGARNWRPYMAAFIWLAGLYALASLLAYQMHLGLNLAGRAGASLAGAMSVGFGLSSYAFPVLAVLWGANVWLRRPPQKDALQTLFILLVATFFASFLAYFAPNVVVSGPPGSWTWFRLGGGLGRGIVTDLESIIGPAGTIIALVGGITIVLALFTRLRLPELGWLRALAIALWNRLKHAAKPKPKPVPVVQDPLTTTRPEPKPVETAAPATTPVAAQPVPAQPKPQPKPARRLGLVPIKFNLSEFQKTFLEQLDQPSEKDKVFKDRKESEQESDVLLDKLRQFDIDGRVSDILSGPMITRFEFEPAPGVKIQSIASRADDLSLALSAERIRILAPIPGKNAVGIEIPNKDRRTVYLREVLTSESFREETSPLGFALGTTITGEPYSADLRTMPHILIAGTTGSGKSVCINSIIASIIYRSSHRAVRFLTIDPKQLELPVYNPIPHLLSTTTIDPRKAVDELNRIVAIMEARYGAFAAIGVRDIVGYNQRAEQDGFEKKPYIVVIIDELADLMLRAPNEIEERITRLAQMSRAVGIHLVLATQRPSVDVITGLIKANFPCRCAFQVASKTDSRTILDMNGAESLLGRGDMLFLPPGKGEPVRLHGSFVSDRAARNIVDLWAATYLAELLNGLVDDPAEKARQIVAHDVVDVFYDKEKSGIKKKLEVLRTILPEDVVDNLMARKYYDTLPEESPEALAERTRGRDDEDRELDEKFTEAAQIVVRHREASVSMLQRRLDVGWARAGRIIDQLEQAGIVGPYVGSKSRKVLVDGEASLQKLIADMAASRATPAAEAAGEETEPESGDGDAEPEEQ